MQAFEEEDDPSRRSFFSEIISSIADVRYFLNPFSLQSFECAYPFDADAVLLPIYLIRRPYYCLYI